MLLWILEDEIELAEIIAAVARRCGFDVVVFKSLAGASLSLESEQRPDLVISDFLLPDGISESWMKSIRQRYPSCQVICFSASLDLSVRMRLQKLGIQAFHKPESLLSLFELLAASCDEW